MEGREGEEVSKKYQAESERESQPPIYLIWCHGILGPRGDRIRAPDAISHTNDLKSESYTHLHQGMEMFLKEYFALWGFDL